MKIDIKQFQQDLAAARHKRTAKPKSGARELTGAMAVIRELLHEISNQRALRATWSQIASGLAAQGVSQIAGGKKAPITGRRVSALVDSIRRQDDRRRRAADTRKKRSDLPPETHSDVAKPNEQGPAKPAFRLSAELDAESMPPPAYATANVTELALRRSALEGIKDLLKKDTIK